MLNHTTSCCNWKCKYMKKHKRKENQLVWKDEDKTNVYEILIPSAITFQSISLVCHLGYQEKTHQQQRRKVENHVIIGFRWGVPMNFNMKYAIHYKLYISFNLFTSSAHLKTCRSLKALLYGGTAVLHSISSSFLLFMLIHLQINRIIRGRESKELASGIPYAMRHLIQIHIFVVFLSKQEKAF